MQVVVKLSTDRHSAPLSAHALAALNELTRLEQQRALSDTASDAEILPAESEYDFNKGLDAKLKASMKIDLEDSTIERAIVFDYGVIPFAGEIE